MCVCMVGGGGGGRERERGRGKYDQASQSGVNVEMSCNNAIIM